MGTNFPAPNENAIEFLRGQKRTTVTLTEPRYVNRIRKLAEQYPDEVEIVADGPSNGGYLYAHIPTAWVRIQPPKKMNYTEEQLENRRAAMRALNGTQSRTLFEKNDPKTDFGYEDEEFFNEND